MFYLFSLGPDNTSKSLSLSSLVARFGFLALEVSLLCDGLLNQEIAAALLIACYLLQKICMTFFMLIRHSIEWSQLLLFNIFREEVESICTNLTNCKSASLAEVSCSVWRSFLCFQVIRIIFSHAAGFGSFEPQNALLSHFCLCGEYLHHFLQQSAL